MALLGAEKIAALAEDSTEVRGDEGGFAMHGAMAMGCLVESAGEKNGSFFQLAGNLTQHREVVEAHRHTPRVSGKFEEIGCLGVMQTGGFRLAEIFLGHGHLGRHPRRLG